MNQCLTKPNLNFIENEELSLIRNLFCASRVDSRSRSRMALGFMQTWVFLMPAQTVLVGAQLHGSLTFENSVAYLSIDFSLCQTGFALSTC